MINVYNIQMNFENYILINAILHILKGLKVTFNYVDAVDNVTLIY